MCTIWWATNTYWVSFMHKAMEGWAKPKTRGLHSGNQPSHWWDASPRNFMKGRAGWVPCRGRRNQEWRWDFSRADQEHGKRNGKHQGCPLMDEMVFEERKAMGSHWRVLDTRTARTPLQENSSGGAGKGEWEKGETTVPFRGKRKTSFSATKSLQHKNCFNFIPQWALKRQQRHNCSQVNRNENVMLDPTASWCCKLYQEDSEWSSKP